MITKMLSALMILASTAVYAADCTEYPFGRGTDYEIIDGSNLPKILSTAVAIPFSADAEDVNDAYTEAELQAKANVVKLMQELVSSENKIGEEARKISRIQNDTRSANVERTKIVLKKISSSANAVLRGVVYLGDCYTPGREVRVTVGIKPETLAVATGLASEIGSSVSNVPTPKTNSQDVANSASSAAEDTGDQSSESNLRKVEGSSNTKKLNNF